MSTISNGFRVHHLESPTERILQLTVCDSPNTFSQALLLLGILSYFEMSRKIPDGSTFVGFRCTNKDCNRIFTTQISLKKHKQHRSSRATPCANMSLAETMYEITDRRAGSLQPSRIMTVPFSGDVAHSHTDAKLRKLRVLNHITHC